MRADAVEKIVQVATRFKLTTAGIFIRLGIRGRHFQLARVERLAHSDIVRNLDHHAGRRIRQDGRRRTRRTQVSSIPLPLLKSRPARRLEPASPREIPAGKYTVILEPAAVLDLAGFMFWDFGGLSILDQRSFLNNRVGTQIFGENINIWDDAAHPLQSGTPFGTVKAFPGSGCTWWRTG